MRRLVFCSRCSHPPRVPSASSSYSWMSCGALMASTGSHTLLPRNNLSRAPSITVDRVAVSVPERHPPQTFFVVECWEWFELRSPTEVACLAPFEHGDIEHIVYPHCRGHLQPIGAPADPLDDGEKAMYNIKDLAPQPQPQSTRVAHPAFSSRGR